MAETKKNYDFGEKKVEKIKGKDLPVWQSPKYLASKDAAIKILSSKEFGGILSENDFWILKNTYSNGEKMQYSGLIVTHDGLLKINENLPEDKRFDQRYCSHPTPFEYGGKKGMVMYYRDERDGMLEIGEISASNLASDSYPFAMLLKRTFDRVVKRKAGLIGILSEAETDNLSIEDPESPLQEEKTAKRKLNIPVEKPVEKNTEAKSEKVDLETGEILEEPKEEVKEEVMTLESALSHVLESRGGAGKTVKALLESENLTDSQKTNYLSKYIADTNENDRKACLVAKMAIDAGITLFKNSKAS